MRAAQSGIGCTTLRRILCGCGLCDPELKFGLHGESSFGTRNDESMILVNVATTAKALCPVRFPNEEAYQRLTRLEAH